MNGSRDVLLGMAAKLTRDAAGMLDVGNTGGAALLLRAVIEILKAADEESA